MIASAAISLGSKFLAQFALGIFSQLLFSARVLQPHRQVLPSLIQPLQHVISLSPASPSAGGGFDHLQARLGFGATRSRLLFDDSEPGPIAAQLFDQNSGVRSIKISRAIDASFYQQ